MSSQKNLTIRRPDFLSAWTKAPSLGGRRCWGYQGHCFQLSLCEAQPSGPLLRMPNISDPTRKILGENSGYGPWEDSAMRQEWLSLASEQQGPTATGFDSVSFPGVSFDHKHLTVEVEHRKLSVNSGHWFLPIPAANNLANSVTPGPSMGIVRDCSASQTAAGQAAAQKHGSFLNQFASICLKITVSIRHMSSYWFRR